MNLISYDSAISLFPKATFEDRRAVSFDCSRDAEKLALQKYTNRGWKIGPNILPFEASGEAPFYVGTHRWVNDDKSWIVPLDMIGITMPVALSESSRPLTWDPIIHNSFRLEKFEEELTVSYSKAESSILRYPYLVADGTFLQLLIDFFLEQGKAQHWKTSSLPDVEKEKCWTWYAITSLK